MWLSSLVSKIIWSRMWFILCILEKSFSLRYETVGDRDAVVEIFFFIETSTAQATVNETISQNLTKKLHSHTFQSKELLEITTFINKKIKKPWRMPISHIWLEQTLSCHTMSNEKRSFILLAIDHHELILLHQVV